MDKEACHPLWSCIFVTVGDIPAWDKARTKSDLNQNMSNVGLSFDFQLHEPINPHYCLNPADSGFLQLKAHW